MRILLLGEYSGFFTTLKEGLKSLDYDVTHVARKDGFKGYEVDHSLEISFFTKKTPNIIRKILLKITAFDIADLEVFFKFWKFRASLINYDVVQIINVLPIQIHPILEKICLKFIFKNNSKVFLSACGDDYVYVNYLMTSKLEYHILKPYLDKRISRKHYKYILKYLTKRRIKLHEFVIQKVKAIIPSDFDYVMAYRNHKKVLPLIPNPINTERLKYINHNLNNKIVIFHGINQVNYFKKGNDIFETALKKIMKRYPNDIEVIVTTSLPYNEYINAYNKAHILLDQVYAYDQGFNALEAMGKGKVVFTGAGKEWLDYYNLKEDTVVINALPNKDKIVEKLEWLISNPDEIERIGKNARKFIEREHNYIAIAEKYVACWKM